MQKVFNTGKALERLECEDALGVCTAVAPSVAQNIVDGNREATLRLLWSIIARFSLPVLLDREAFASEAEAVISATGKWRRADLTVAYPELPPLKMPDVAALRESWSDSSGGVTSDQMREKKTQELLSALLAWCQAVCHGYCVPVNNFTTSFADGRALCLLVHYYHPWVSERPMLSNVRAKGGEGRGVEGDVVYSAIYDQQRVRVLQRFDRQ